LRDFACAAQGAPCPQCPRTWHVVAMTAGLCARSPSTRPCLASRRHCLAWILCRMVYVCSRPGPNPGMDAASCTRCIRLGRLLWLNSMIRGDCVYILILCPLGCPKSRHATELRPLNRTARSERGQLGLGVRPRSSRPQDPFRLRRTGTPWALSFGSVTMEERSYQNMCSGIRCDRLAR
jgi:hypothetical protein